MKKNLLFLIAAAGLMTLAACGGGTAPADRTAASATKPCDEVYADGVVFKTIDDLSPVCDRAGGAYLPASATTGCADGRTLYWNDEGWGFLGEPFSRHAPGAEQVAPEADSDVCTP